MEISEAWWRLFTLTGNIEAYLLYRGLLQPESFAATTGQVAAVSELQHEGS